MTAVYEFVCCKHCGCSPDDRVGHDDTCRYGCNDRTAYCPVCREDVAVTWSAPPYSVAHVLDTDPPVHRHPVTAEVVPSAGQATIAGYTHIREAKEQGK